MIYKVLNACCYLPVLTVASGLPDSSILNNDPIIPITDELLSIARYTVISAINIPIP